MSHIGDLFRCARKKAGLSLKDCACAAGFKNLAKQMRVLAAIEDGKSPFPKDAYLERFARILGIHDADIVQAMSLDYVAYESWCNTPIKLHLRVRLVATVYAYQSLPDGCTREQAEEIARQISQERKMIVWLVYARGHSKIFKPDGTVAKSCPPMMQIGRFGRRAMAMAKRAASVPAEQPRTDGKDALGE